MGVQIRVYDDEVREKARELRRKVGSAMDFVLKTIGVEGKFKMIELAPQRTGRLRRSISYFIRQIKSGKYVVIYPTAYYAKFVEYGTKPHDIFPRRAKFLRFVIEGKVIFAKHVRHPGFYGRFFVKRTHEWLSKQLPRIIEKALGWFRA